MGDTRRGSCAG